jgi:hypothetical protein
MLLKTDNTWLVLHSSPANTSILDQHKPRKHMLFLIFQIAQITNRSQHYFIDSVRFFSLYTTINKGLVQKLFTHWPASPLGTCRGHGCPAAVWHPHFRHLGAPWIPSGKKQPGSRSKRVREREREREQSLKWGTRLPGARPLYWWW